MARKAGRNCVNCNPKANKYISIHLSVMTHPGTYRVKNLIDEELGWEGRPSSNFEIHGEA